MVAEEPPRSATAGRSPTGADATALRARDVSRPSCRAAAVPAIAPATPSGGERAGRAGGRAAGPAAPARRRAAAHSLLAIASPSSAPTAIARRRDDLGRPGEEHGGDAQARAEQLLGVAEFERAQRDRVGDAEAQRDGARQQRPVLGAHPRERARQPSTADGQQAGEGEHAIDRERAAAPQRREQRERGALDQRAAVDGGERTGSGARWPCDERFERPGAPRLRSRSRRTRTGPSQASVAQPAAAISAHRAFSRRTRRMYSHRPARTST